MHETEINNYLAVIKVVGGRRRWYQRGQSE